LKKIFLVSVMAVLGALAGCGKDAQIPYLTTITITPGSQSVVAGNTQQFNASGTFSDGSSQDLTKIVAWTSSTKPVATIGPQGLATTYSQGTSTISASFPAVAGVVTGTTTVTVTPPSLVAIVVTDASTVVPTPTPSAAKIGKGTGHQYAAYGVYSDGGERWLPGLTWATNPTPSTVATVNSSGHAMGLNAGTVKITATDPTTNIFGATTLTVTDAFITSITVSPVIQTIAPTTTLGFTALAWFTDQTTQDITADATWSSTLPSVATVAPGGVALGLAQGVTSIQASMNSVTGAAPLNVSSATLTSIALLPTVPGGTFASTQPTSIGVAIGSTMQMNAVGTFSDGTKQTLTQASTWSITPNDGSIAKVSTTGLVTGVASGSATVKAQFGSVSHTAVLAVQSLTSIAVTPGPATVAQGSAVPFDAVATLTDGSKQDVTSSVTWISTTPSTATVTANGWASGITKGTTTISAILASEWGNSLLTVTDATLKSLAVTPATAQDIALGTTQQFKATGTFSDATTQDLTYQSTWSSTNVGVAVVSGTGLATSTGVGTATVSAAGNINGSAATDTKVLTVHGSVNPPAVVE
jgi:trimeric autotransporter adhesin